MALAKIYASLRCSKFAVVDRVVSHFGQGDVSLNQILCRYTNSLKLFLS